MLTTQNAYRDRGWVQCNNRIEAGIIEDAGGDVEWAPGAMFQRLVHTAVEREKHVDELGRPYWVDVKPILSYERTENCAFTPLLCMQVYRRLSKLPSISKDARRAALHLLLVDGEKRDAFDTVLGFGKEHGAAAFVRSLVRGTRMKKRMEGCR